jgi:hypothetical protein
MLEGHFVNWAMKYGKNAAAEDAGDCSFGYTFGSADELVEEVCEMTSAIPRAKLETVLLEWDKRLLRCIGISGA